MSKTFVTDTPGVDWRQERAAMAADVRRHILDPFAPVAGWIAELDEKTQFAPSRKDLSGLLSLLVLGAHKELDLYLSDIGHLVPPVADILEEERKKERA